MHTAEQTWTDFYLQPGRFLESAQLDRLATELSRLDGRSGRHLGDIHAILERRALALARRSDGQLVACCTASPVVRSGRPVLEIAPTVVAPGHDPETFGPALEHTLVRTFLLRQRPLGRIWVGHGRSDPHPRAMSLMSFVGKHPRTPPQPHSEFAPFGSGYAVQRG